MLNISSIPNNYYPNNILSDINKNDNPQLNIINNELFKEPKLDELFKGYNTRELIKEQPLNNNASDFKILLSIDRSLNNDIDIYIDNDHFDFYKNNHLIGSFNIEQLLKYMINSNNTSNFLYNINMHNSIPIIEQFICKNTIVSDSITIQLINSNISPFMGNVELLIKLNNLLNDYETNKLDIILQKVNTEDYLKLNKSIHKIIYIFINYTLKIIAYISQKINTQHKQNIISNEIYSFLSNKLTKYSIGLVYRLSYYCKKQINHQISENIDIKNSISEIKTLQDKTDKKINKIEKHLINQNNQIMELQKKLKNSTKNDVVSDVILPDVSMISISNDIRSKYDSISELLRNENTSNTNNTSDTSTKSDSNNRNQNNILNTLIEKLSNDKNVKNTIIKQLSDKEHINDLINKQTSENKNNTKDSIIKQLSDNHEDTQNIKNTFIKQLSDNHEDTQNIKNTFIKQLSNKDNIQKALSVINQSSDNKKNIKDILIQQMSENKDNMKGAFIKQVSNTVQDNITSLSNSSLSDSAKSISNKINGFRELSKIKNYIKLEPVEKTGGKYKQQSINISDIEQIL
jgi:hypothetical protein